METPYSVSRGGRSGLVPAGPDPVREELKDRFDVVDLMVPDLKQLGDHRAAGLDGERSHLQDAEARHVHRSGITWVLEEDDRE